MNRLDIKFRIPFWRYSDGTFKDFFFGGYIAEGKFSSGGSDVQCRPGESQLYSTLKDRKGNEIYVGDVISPVEINGSISEGVVFYAEGCYRVCKLGGEHLTEDLYGHNQSAEIIDNICANSKIRYSRVVVRLFDLAEERKRNSER